MYMDYLPTAVWIKLSPTLTFWKCHLISLKTGLGYKVWFRVSHEIAVTSHSGMKLYEGLIGVSGFTSKVAVSHG